MRHVRREPLYVRRNPRQGDGSTEYQDRATGNRRLLDVIGVWFGFGVGAPKQYFITRKVGARLRGMVCGACDNPYTMAALDDFEIQRRLGRRRLADVL